MPQHPGLSPHQQPALPLIQMREDRPELRRQQLPGFPRPCPTPYHNSGRKPGNLRVIYRQALTWAMSLLRAGVDTSVIALWLGHEDAETTQVYLNSRELHQPGGETWC